MASSSGITYKMFKKIIFFLLCIRSFNGQHMESIYFPDDDSDIAYSPAQTVGNKDLANITQIIAYDQFIDQVISGGITQLTLSLNRALSTNTQNEFDNIVFAPLSIAGALAVVLLGSNSKTFEELTMVLGLTSGVNVQQNSLQVHQHYGQLFKKMKRVGSPNQGQQINYATGVFVQKGYPVRDIYKKAVEDIYQGDVVNVNFQTNAREAHETINSWASIRTNRKVTNILAETPSAATKIIIASVLHFKAQWEYPFFNGITARRPFYANGRTNDTNIEVDMMANGGSFPYFKDTHLNCEIMGFPYKGNETTMYVVIPANSNANILKKFETKLTSIDLEYLADNTVPTKSVLLFPKMKIEKTLDLRAALQINGVKSLFDPLRANLALLSPGDALPDTISGISTTKINNPNKKIRSEQPANESLDNLRLLINQHSLDNNYQNPGLYADKVLHKVFMDITESGTEAAASTSVSLSRDGGRVAFRVDVPFLFFIRHEMSKAILFWGSVYSPTPNFKKI